MNIRYAMDSIEKVSGMTDPTTQVGEAWEFIQDYIYRLEEVITPSLNTKAAFMGEFANEFKESECKNAYISWDSIKEIMKAMRKRAKMEDV